MLARLVPTFATRNPFGVHLLPLRLFAITTESSGAGETNLNVSGTTGIEHAYAHNKLGSTKHQQNWSDYKCAEYLHCSTMSYYDKEVEMERYRVPQPSSKHPDVEPSVKQSAPSSTVPSPEKK